MIQREVVVVGAGPAGLCASIEARRKGAEVLLIDENSRPGGQLFKQIHKFFGSKDHKAGIRGINIGTQLLKDAQQLNIETWLGCEVCGIFDENELWVVCNRDRSVRVKAERIILATGAMENSVNFPGWTLPGVMGAGAAQTMINLHRVKPGDNILMVGSGNVGVIVSYQLLQAGCNVVGIVEAAPQLGGYGVHTAKVRRAGVPFYTSHTVKKAEGVDHVRSATVVKLDPAWNQIEGSEFTVSVDTICIAAGLTPLAELAFASGCEPVYSPVLGGMVPLHDDHMHTSVSSIYIAGDISGVEEASTAMEEGRLAGLSASHSLGYVDKDKFQKEFSQAVGRLNVLRSGLFGQKRLKAKEEIFTKKKG
ncbi:MAG: NAD(P)/FAD-dependent oxidoreductase [Sphaerochaetaceae bacterium]|nr:NAD(P)/FAD-dependent oxidoreductase [Sphaerochaetaceae bacterium]